MTGIVMSFDKHWNIALSDVFEVWKRRKTHLCPTSDFGKNDLKFFKAYLFKNLFNPYRLSRRLYRSSSSITHQTARSPSEIVKSQTSRMLETLGPGDDSRRTSRGYRVVGKRQEIAKPRDDIDFMIYCLR